MTLSEGDFKIYSTVLCLILGYKSPPSVSLVFEWSFKVSLSKDNFQLKIVKVKKSVKVFTI